MLFIESFPYKAASWSKDKRVACKVERKVGELFPRHHFVITNLDSSPVEIFKAYQKRGNMENFIKEAKLDFGMNQLSHSSFIAYAKLRIKALAYNIINFMKRLVLPKKLQKIRMQSIRALFIKIASRFTCSKSLYSVTIIEY